MSTESAACSRCGHADDKHRNNKCHHLDTWLGLYKREYRECTCWMSGPEDRLAGALWNSYLGRPQHDFLDAKQAAAGEKLEETG